MSEPLHGAEIPAIYVRVSTKGQEEDGTLLEAQEQACREYCRAHGWPVDEPRGSAQHG